MLSISNVIIEKEILDSFLIHYWPDKEFDRALALRLAYHRILLVCSGKGKVRIDDTLFELSTAQLFLVAKGQVVRMEEGTSFTGYELSFGDCFWERSPSSASNCKALLFDNAAANQMLLLRKEEDSELVVLLNSLWLEFTKPSYTNKLDAMAAYLKIIMIKLANVQRSATERFDSYERKIYREFNDLVTAHYLNVREVSVYASMLGVTTRKLADISKIFSGKGAKELINMQVVMEAKRLLQFSQKSVKEIAFQLNFGTPEQFSHFFKKNTDVSPQVYRSLFLEMGS